MERESIHNQTEDVCLSDKQWRFRHFAIDKHRGVLSDAIHAVVVKRESFNISIVDLYAPTAQSTKEETEKCYYTLDTAQAQCKSQ